MTGMLKRAYNVLRVEGLSSFRSKALWWIQEFSRVCYATVTVRSFTRDHEPKQLVDFVFKSYGGLLKPLQIKDEIIRLVQIVKDKNPSTILEIGTACGGTLLLFCRAASNRAKIISIDLPYGMFGWGYPIWRTPLYKSFARFEQDIALIRKDSHENSTLTEAKSALGGRPVDFLFIDGDHTYEGVKKDFEMYSPLVRKNGIIAMHDIAEHPKEMKCNVSKFWEEVKQRYRNIEIIAEKGQIGFGIGVLYVE